MRAFKKILIGLLTLIGLAIIVIIGALLLVLCLLRKPIIFMRK